MENELTEMLSLPVKVADHYKFSVIFFTLGFFLTCWFFLYIVNFVPSKRKLSREILLSLFASIYLGLGSFFLALSLGVNIWRKLKNLLYNAFKMNIAELIIWFDNKRKII